MHTEVARKFGNTLIRRLGDSSIRAQDVRTCASTNDKGAAHFIFRGERILSAGEQRQADVRYGAHTGLKSDIAPCPKSANDRDRGEPRGSAPPTPPYVRVRIRRFEKLR